MESIYIRLLWIFFFWERQELKITIGFKTKTLFHFFPNNESLSLLRPFFFFLVLFVVLLLKIVSFDSMKITKISIWVITIISISVLCIFNNFNFSTWFHVFRNFIFLEKHREIERKNFNLQHFSKFNIFAHFKVKFQ